jgi:hypothetical protein
LAVIELLGRCWPVPSSFLKVMRGLQVHPEFSRDAETTGQAQRRVGGDRPFAMQYLGNAVGRAVLGCDA